MSSLKLDVEIMHPPALVWRALTEAKPLNEWFQPIAGWPESGARPGSQGRVFPTDDLRGFGSFEMNVVEAEPHSLLVNRWRGEDFTSEMSFEIRPIPAGGSRLLVRQAGFLGTHETERRETLALAHHAMMERLLVAVDRLALGFGEGEFLHAEAPKPSPPALETHHRVRLVAVVCVVVVAGLCGTAAAVWMQRGAPLVSAPGNRDGGGSGLSSGVQQPPVAGSSPTRSPAVGGTKESNAPSPSPAAVPARPSGKPLVASYRIHSLPVGLLGFDTEVTVRNPGAEAKNGWTVVLTMPDATTVDNRSGQVVKLRQERDVVTVTPVTAALPAGASVTFTIRFPALLALGPLIKGCTIDGMACGAA